MLKIKNWKAENNSLAIGFDKGQAKISFAEKDILRFRYTEKEILQNEESFILDGDTSDKDFEVKQDKNYLLLATEKIKLEVCLEPFGIKLMNNNGTVIAASAYNFLSTNENSKIVRFKLEEDEGIYGLGQDPMANLNQRDKERRMWQQWGSNDRSGNGGVPFMLSTKGYGVLLNSSYPSRFAIGKAEVAEFSRMGDIMAPAPWSWSSDSGETEADTSAILLDEGEMDLFIICDEGFDNIINGYSKLTGFSPLLPKWAYGFIQCRNRYRSQEELLNIARTIRKKKIPCDVLVIDWLWFREFGDVEWDKRYWPNVEEMFEELKEMSFKVMQAQHPFISEGGLKFKEFQDKGYINKVPEGKRYTFDHSNPEARKEWWSKFRSLYEQGIKGYWTDMGELEEHFEGTESYLGGREKVHNIYSLLWAKGLYDGQRNDFGERVFTLARTAYAGMQKYGATLWSGDIDASWETLKRQVVVGQEVCLSGIPYWTTDIGGFITNMDFTPELFIRWLQWGVFCPLFRTHGTRPANELWSFGKEAEKICKEYVELRYKLFPYIYSCAKEVTDSGKPMMRAMVLDYADDSKAVASTLQFMFGPSILVAPVVEKGGRRRELHLPEGTWYDFWTGKRYEGKTSITVSAPLNRIPLFIKAGAVIPMGSSMEYIDDAAKTDTTVHIYTGSSSSFKLYDDDGRSYSYESGNYIETMVEYKEDKSKVINIYPLHVDEGILQNRNYTIIVHNVDKPTQVLINNVDNSSWSYGDEERQLTVYCKAVPLSSSTSIGIREFKEADHSEKPVDILEHIKIFADTDLENNGMLTVNLSVDATSEHSDLLLNAKLCVPEGWTIRKSERTEHDINSIWKLNIYNKDIQETKIYPGASLSWTVNPSAEALSVISEGKIEAEYIQKGECIKKVILPIEWGSGYITRCSLLGSFENWDNSGLDSTYEPDTDPEKPYYMGKDKKYSWFRDTANEYNCFGYVDFRRLGVYNDGEPINGVAYAKCSLWSSESKEVYLEVSAETGIKIYLNEEEIFKSKEIVVGKTTAAPIQLKGGWNNLLVKSTVFCEKPYSGREYGFNIRLVDENRKTVRDILVKP